MERLIMKAKQVLSLVVLAGMMLSGCGVSFSGFRAKAQRDDIKTPDVNELKKTKQRQQQRRGVMINQQRQRKK